MAIGESAGLLFRIKGDSTDAVKAIRDVERAENDLDGTNKSLTDSFASITSVASIAGAGILAVGAAAVTAARGIFSLTMEAAEYGSAIFDASQKTGLSAEALTSMDVAAKQSGTSLDEVTSATAKFAKTIGEAINGSEQAAEKLARLGVTSTDLDTALAQALTTIAKAPAGIRQMTLAQDAFGRSGAQLLPFIKSFDGDLVKLIQKTKDLGLTLSNEAVSAADEFGDQMDTLSAQIAATGRTIGFAFMPLFLEMSQGLSNFLKNNKDDIETWGYTAANAFRLAILGMQSIVDFVQRNEGTFRIAIAVATLGWSEIVRKIAGDFGDAFAANTEQWRTKLSMRPSEGRGGGDTIPLPNDPGTNNKTSNAANKAARDAERQARQDLQAEVRTEQINLKTIQDTFKANIEALIKSATTKEDFIAQWNESMKLFNANLKTSLQYIEERETALLGADASEAERTALQAQQAQRRRELEEANTAFRLQSIEDISTAQENADKQAFDALMKQIELNWKLGQAERDRIAAEEKRLQNAPSTIIVPSIEPTLEDQGLGSVFDSWTASWINFFDRIKEDGPNLTSMLGDIANVLQGAFEGMAHAIGSMVENWVLFGETGPAVMRKILAQALASIAAESAVRAIFELAKGFAALFLNPAEATAHFTAAALFGSIAVGSALAGRAIAGDSFKREASGGRAGAVSNTSNEEEERRRAISRQSDGAYSSGNPWQRASARMEQIFSETKEMLQANTQSNLAFAGAIGSLPAGEVLTRGIAQKPGAIGKAIVEDVGRNSRIGSDLMRATGNR